MLWWLDRFCWLHMRKNALLGGIIKIADYYLHWSFAIVVTMKTAAMTNISKMAPKAMYTDYSKATRPKY
jgi:hypothetical protein